MSTADTTPTTAFYWVLIACVNCEIFHHYRPTTDNEDVLVCTRSGGYPGCGHTIRLADVRAPAPGDTIAVVDGVLKYGIDPTAHFVHKNLNGEFRWPRTLAASDLADYLSRICVWQGFTISRALIDAARNGTYDYVDGYGLKTRITREGHR
ncbi:hypothetical protein [Streptomyces sp. NPDC094468]|uniref:hypothetical protein n=1 Tax=Streptomyces sp. NPDC094468 TaxID=3366066 RepID=UPI003819FEC5